LAKISTDTSSLSARTGPKGRQDSTDFDAIVVGAGFGGLYALKRLRDDLKLNTLLIEQGGGLGGTWYWNRYPGAMSDTRSHLYCYSFDKDLLQEDEFAHHYRLQPQVLKYLETVAERFKLMPNIRLNTQLARAYYDATTDRWNVTTDAGDSLSARYIITALGLLSKINLPPIEGLESFGGELVHTGRWPPGTRCDGKRVGIIGTGSTGVQVITAIAPVVKTLTVFQRSAQYSVPSGYGPTGDAFVSDIKKRYEDIWEQEKNSLTAMGAKESAISAMSVSAEERQRVFEDAWNDGGGFRFMFGTFNDIITSKEANQAAQEFICKKIAEIVKDPEKARKLTPKDLYAKRPLCDAGYFEQFNRSNVDLVDIRDNPIAKITPRGVLTADGVEHPLDILIFATGFDAVDGNYLRLDIRGRNGISIKDLWREGARTYLGVFNVGFPNMFMVLGPNSPFSNLPPAIETQVDMIADVIGRALNSGKKRVEASSDAADAWLEECRVLADMTLLPQAQSWIFGANIPGKPYTLSFHMGGLKTYRSTLAKIKAEGYPGLRIE
jgi:cyclohexanone monooxygenase